MTDLSLEAFTAILPSLTNRREQLVRYLFKCKRSTISMYAESLSVGKNSVSGRFSELHQMGIIKIVGRTDKESIYALNMDGNYKELPKKITSKEMRKKIKEIILKYKNGKEFSDIINDLKKLL